MKNIGRSYMGTLKGFALPFGPPPHHPRSLPPSGLRDLHLPTTPARCARALALGLAMPSAMVRRRRRGRAKRGRVGWAVRPKSPQGEPAGSPRGCSSRHVRDLRTDSTARAEDERPGVFTYAYQGLVVGVEPDWPRLPGRSRRRPAFLGLEAHGLRRRIGALVAAGLD